MKTRSPAMLISMGLDSPEEMTSATRCSAGGSSSAAAIFPADSAMVSAAMIWRVAIDMAGSVIRNETDDNRLIYDGFPAHFCGGCICETRRTASLLRKIIRISVNGPVLWEWFL